MQQHSYSLSELESMLPWEREIYVAMLSQFLEDEAMTARHNEQNR
jgi:hypothetical protein|tara:strand:+ start:84 stop:218 length:135 start_codon:yes stop_codon:yes gene_type:complete